MQPILFLQYTLIFDVLDGLCSEVIFRSIAHI